jgi:crotonobetainyl-CoA:carnitine CoA-transferase CaiB-like acyl-CoA transferase
MLPLEGLVVLDFSQYYAGPSATLRLADLGARVIKIERTGTGDQNRQLRLKNLEVDGDSLLFHTLNRNKDSYGANLKDPEDLARVRSLVAKADVLVQNFRPGVMERLGLGYGDTRVLNPRLVYASVSGYGRSGPWKDKPGQDLLVQARSGAGYLQGRDIDPPMPTSMAVADAFTGAYLVQGVLACVVRREKTGEGGLVEVSLMESMLDAQIDMFVTYLRDREVPERCIVNGGHIYNAAPYGFYQTTDGYLALAMASIRTLAEVIGTDDLDDYFEERAKFDHRDEVKGIIARHLRAATTAEWIERFGERDVWCGEVLEWRELVEHDGFKSMDLLIEVTRPSGASVQTLRCPIRIDGVVLKSPKWAPVIGEHNAEIDQEFELDPDPSGERSAP